MSTSRCILSLCLFNLYAEYIMGNVRLEDSQAGIKISRRNISTSDMLSWWLPLGFSGGSDSKEFTCSAGDLGSILGLGRSPGEEHGNPLQYSFLENSHGQKSLVSYSPWGLKELDTTEWLTHTKWEQWQIFFSWALKSLLMVTAARKLKDACSLEEKLWQT